MFWNIALLFSVLCTLDLTLAQQDQSGQCYNTAPRYERVVITTRDGGAPTNTLTDVLDPGHAKMLAVGGYTSADVATLETEALDYFQSQFGLNFTGAPAFPLNPVAKYILIGAVPALLVPYGTSAAAGAQYRVSFDSNFVERGDGTWFVREFGMAVALQGAGVIPGGVRQGDLFLANDVLVYNHYNWLKEGANYSDPSCGDDCREVIKIQTWTPARTVPNTNNLTDTIIKMTATSVSHSLGVGDAQVLVSLRYPQGTTSNPQQSIRATLTWVCDGPSPCPATVPQPQPAPVPPCSGAGFTYASMIGFLFIILASIF